MLMESSVRSYSRDFPDTFAKATGSYIFNLHGRKYLDFLSGCGSLNYGHNHHFLKEKLLSYIESDGISMSLDMVTDNKLRFLDALDKCVLAPKGLEYKAQFTGPTGTNAVEAAIKLARTVTGRTNVISFTNGFHGCTLGSLALTGNSHHRRNSAALLNHVTRAAYDGYFGKTIDTSSQIDKMLDDPSSGIDAPAAFIVEAIQGEGGINAAASVWMKQIAQIARKHGALLIVDDIQAGCGRSGDFFSFEQAGIKPDIIVLAKSLSGYGLPLSMVLLRPEVDAWLPGEHNGTFRGHNLAFITATAALEYFWKDSTFKTEVSDKAEGARNVLQAFAAKNDVELRGRGLMLGLKFENGQLVDELRAACFNEGLILESCGPRGEVLKFLPPLTIAMEDLMEGIEIVTTQFARCVEPAAKATAAA